MYNLVTSLSGVDYSSLIASNPYRNASQLYHVSGWQDFLSNNGFRTEADAWKENMTIQEREYDAALQQKLLDQKYNEEYNSPVAQVSRLKQAGLNPDLDPSMVDSSSLEAPGLPQDPSTPMQSTGASGTFEELANFVFNAVTAGFEISRDIFSMNQLRLSNQDKKVGIADSIVDLAFRTAVGAYPSNPDKDPVNSAHEMNERVKLVNETVGSLLPRSLQKRFRQNLSRFMTSLPTEAEAYKLLSDRASSRTSYFRQRGSEYYSESDEVMSSINSELISLADRLTKQSAENALVGAEKQGEYLQEADGTLEGTAQNARNSLDIQQNTMSREINSTMSSIVHRLAAQAKQGNVLAEGVLLIFNVLRLKSLNVSSGPKGSSFGLSF